MSASQRLLDDLAARRRPLKILGASGQLGYGIPTPAFNAGLDRSPDLVGCDMGSIDIGPYYLGSGELATALEATRRDLKKVIVGARKLDVPLIIGSAGSAGSNRHLEQTLALVRDIARETGLRFRLGSIQADIPPHRVRAAIRAGEVTPIDDMPALTEDVVETSSAIVGQMGMGAFQRALAEGVDVLVTGRACDTSIFASLPTMAGFEPGLCVHLAKIIECASICCLPGGRDAILAVLDEEGFVLESMAPQRRATPLSVAAHSLYEQSNPYSVHEPEGMLDLRQSHYEAVDDRRTRVSGALWKPADAPTLKIEGSRHVGERAVLICASADPAFLRRHPAITREVEAVVENLVCEDSPRDFDLYWKIYDGTFVSGAPAAAQPGGEAFILLECIAPTTARAMEVVRTAKQYLLHHGFPGRLSTGGNLAFPFTPPEIHTGSAYVFSIYHIMKAPDIDDLFPANIEHL